MNESDRLKQNEIFTIAKKFLNKKGTLLIKPYKFKELYSINFFSDKVHYELTHNDLIPAILEVYNTIVEYYECELF